MRLAWLILIAIAAGELRPVWTYVIFCYYTNWSQYRKGSAKFLPENINPNLCTHILYAFGKLNGNGLETVEWNDDTQISKVVGLKQRNPTLKILLSIGGWNFGSKPFSDLVMAAANREEFADNSVTFLKKYGLDGLDIDWEYPAQRGGSFKDKHNFVLLLQTLKQRFSGDSLLLTAAVGVGRSTVGMSYDVRQIANHVDFINLMTYDFHGGWESQTGHVSPLYPKADETGSRKTLNVDSAVSYWIQQGAPRSKLVMGMPLYGRSFTLTDSSDASIGAPASKVGRKGPLMQTNGVMAYYEVCFFIKSGWRRIWDREQQVPYAVSGDQWVGYDDIQSFNIKSRYIVDNRLAGAMVWALDEDDFINRCGNGEYPLLDAINRVLKGNGGSATIRTPRTVRFTPRPPVRTPPPAITRRPAPGGICPKIGIILEADPTNKRSFYICFWGNGVRLLCPPTLVFDEEKKICNFAHF